MITLRPNSRAPEAALLQRLLNHRYHTDSTVPRLLVDGSFGPRTKARLRQFQTGFTGPGRLTVDGIAGDSTWRALGLTSEVSGGMASGRMASMVPPTATFDPVEASYADGRDGGGTSNDLPNLNADASGLGMRSLDGSPTHINGVLEHVRRGPANLTGNWSNGGSHAVVINGVYELRPLRASSGHLRGGLLGLVVAAAFLGTTPIARADCVEQNLQNELTEPKALTRAGLRTQFREFVLREFPVGGDGARLLRWLKRSDFSEPYTTYDAVLSMTTENYDKEEAAAQERIRQGSPLRASNRSFNSLCGQSIYRVNWKLDTCNRIVELSTDEVRCRLDLP